MRFLISYELIDVEDYEEAQEEFLAYLEKEFYILDEEVTTKNTIVMESKDNSLTAKDVGDYIGKFISFEVVSDIVKIGREHIKVAGNIAYSYY